MGRVESDTGTLKGDFARTRTVQDARNIAYDMGLELVRTLSSDELRDMAGNTLPRDVGRSFRNADLVIEATDRTDTRYIAMEVSFTADRRDCDRAIRNAGAHHPVHREGGAGRRGQRQERQGGGGVRDGVLAPAGGQNAYSRVTLGPSPRLTPERHLKQGPQDRPS